MHLICANLTVIAGVWFWSVKIQEIENPRNDGEYFSRRPVFSAPQEIPSPVAPQGDVCDAYLENATKRQKHAILSEIAPGAG
jgi:hypothetical protein